uniref:Protein CutA, chloroplastic n=1 Tax=Opuntia streptacantha TaxID=393608 RepID=A0A7C8YDL5_OPUST
MVTTPCSSASSRASPSLSPSLLRSSVFRRRLPIVGAICVLSTLSLSNLFPSLSSPFKTTRAHSISSAPLLRSKEQSRGIHATGMEAASSTVPSIVVYVTVPNKEAGKKLAASIVKERLAACVNRVPGIESVYEWKGEGT